MKIFRCPLCPNAGKEGNNKCRSYAEDGSKATTPCQFVKTYRDERGYLYQVVRHRNGWAAQMTRGGRWRKCTGIPVRKTFDEAQTDLNKMAIRKKL